jgi:hypothetical protein
MSAPTYSGPSDGRATATPFTPDTPRVWRFGSLGRSPGCRKTANALARNYGAINIGAYLLWVLVLAIVLLRVHGTAALRTPAGEVMVDELGLIAGRAV